jgi:alkylation response protein AidB-like acyl-CoA dehydrogenase
MTALDDRPLPERTSSLPDVVAWIAEGALARERDRVLPYEPVDRLRAIGFGAARVPTELGGAGESLPELFRMVITLAEADPHVAHLLCGHFGRGRAPAARHLARGAGGAADGGRS